LSKTKRKDDQAHLMIKTITRFLALSGCIFLLSYCSKEQGPMVDYSDPSQFDCNSDLIICTKPDSLAGFGSLDCDNGGISNFHECVAKTSFKNDGDDCEAAVIAKVDICNILRDTTSATGFKIDHVLSQQDCDGGGLTNYIECIKGFSPIKNNDETELNDLTDDNEIVAYLRNNNFIVNDSLSILDTIGIIGTYTTAMDTFEIIRTESGLVLLVDQSSPGTSPSLENNVTYTYSSSYLDKSCQMLDGCELDVERQETSLETNITQSSNVIDLIFGLQEGLTFMTTNSKAKLIIPSRLGYKEVLTFGIPSYSVIIFDIELDSIN